MRIIGEKVTHEMIISDTISSTNIKLLYRAPSTSERHTYMGSLWRRKGDDIEDLSFQTRIHWGKNIITGIGEEQIALHLDGETTPISSNPESKYYRADWKELMEQYLPEMLWLLAFRVFEGSAQLPPQVLQNQGAKEALDSKN